MTVMALQQSKKQSRRVPPLRAEARLEESNRDGRVPVACRFCDARSSEWVRQRPRSPMRQLLQVELPY